MLAYQSREDVWRYVAYRPRTRDRLVELTDPSNVVGGEIGIHASISLAQSLLAVSPTGES